MVCSIKFESEGRGVAQKGPSLAFRKLKVRAERVSYNKDKDNIPEHALKAHIPLE